MGNVYEYDTVILGGGPAGLSAGIYMARSNSKTAIIDTSMLGGQPSNYLELENYPGFPIIGGYDLMEKFEEHADKFGVEKYPMQEIKSVNLVSNPKIVETVNGDIFKSKVIIIACGAKPQKLGVKGENEFIGRGVSYCAVCDGAFYQDKTVVVVGGGNAAVEEGIYLTKFAKKVYIIHRRNELRADKIIQERAFKNNKIEFVWDTIVNEIQGDETVKNIVVQNIKDINGQVKQDENGFIITDETMQTSISGVYAVGDVRRTPLRQVITAASDGAIGAVYAGKYLETLDKISV